MIIWRFPTVLLSLSLLSLTSTFSARIWKNGNGGKLKWAMDCSFKSFDIGHHSDDTGKLCGDFCLANSLCTHFTWSNNVCYMKRITTHSNVVPSYLPMAICGFVIKSSPPVGLVARKVERSLTGREAKQINSTERSRSATMRDSFLSFFKLPPMEKMVAKVLPWFANEECTQSTPSPGTTLNLVWQEEFDTLNTTRWKHIITGWRGGNSEFQYYDSLPENSYVKDGKLYIKPTLTADRFSESFLNTGPLDLTADGCNLNVEGYNCVIYPGVDIINPIQSARIVTQDSFSFTNGVVEVRAKMPKGDWLWPGIWMLPTTSVYGGWPLSGEIDITESRGNNNFNCGGGPIGRQLSGATLHWGPTPAQNQYIKLTGKINVNPDFSMDFHVYKMDWNSNGFTFYVDGQKTGSVTPPDGGFWQLGGFSGNNIWSSGSKMAPFDQPFYFILNVAVGGNFFPDNCCNQDHSKPWAQSDSNQMKKFWSAKNDWYPTWNAGTDDNAMQVDYIRVYSPQ